MICIMMGCVLMLDVKSFSVVYHQNYSFVALNSGLSDLPPYAVWTISGSATLES